MMPAPSESTTTSTVSVEKSSGLGYSRRRVALLVAAVLLFACPLWFGAERVLSAGQALRGVWVGGVSLSGLSASQTTQALSVLDRRLRSRAVSVHVKNSLFELQPEQVALKIDIDKITSAALAAGREGSFWAQWRWWIRRFTTPHSLTLETALDAAALDKAFDEFESAAFGPASSDVGVSVDSGVPRAVYGKVQSRIDRDAARRQIALAFQQEPSELVEIALREVRPLVANAVVDRAVEQAKQLSSAPILLLDAASGSALTISGSELASALTSSATPSGELTLAFDANRLQAAVRERLAAFESAATDARFVTDARQRVRVEPSQPGRAVDSAHLAEAALRAAGTPERSGTLPLSALAPTGLTTEAAQTLGITRYLGQFTTHHACCEARVRNIHRIADLLHNVVVLPGQTFSVNEHVGQRTIKNGFVLAPSIADGEMVETIGGGVSQFATTFFNALFHAGFDIIERQPHSYWFPRYPMGHEATLSWPKPDVIFKNDTAAGLLIQTAYDERHVTVKLYGDNAGRRVEAKVSQQRDIVKPEIQLVPDDDVAPDEEKVRFGGMIGWTVTVGRVTHFADGTSKSEKRDVTYSPRTRIVAVHSCRIPEGMEGYTGTPCPEPEDAELPTEDAFAEKSTLEEKPE